MNSAREPFFYIIAGPTGAGKTELGERLAARVNGEIVNADLGQFYAPLTIGTAKPDWKNSSLRQHLFDYKTEPSDFNCAAYRAQAELAIKDIVGRGKVPIIIGGSGFYYQSLLWNLAGSSEQVFLPPDYIVTWERLNQIDPERAASIHPNDRYRIERALTIAYSGLKPSDLKPLYAPVGRSIVVHVTRSRQDLYARINTRVHTMMQEGWLEEVTQLEDAWREFAQRKKIIGYSEIFEHLQGCFSYSLLVEKIQKSTRNYAKRQLTFFSGMRRRLLAAEPSATIEEVDLTLSSVDLYLDSLTHHPERVYESRC